MFRKDERVSGAILLKELTGKTTHIPLRENETLAAYVFKGEGHTCTYTNTIDDLYYITTHDHGFKNKVIEYGIETRTKIDN